MCLLHIVLHIKYLLLSGYWQIILKKSELIQPLEKMAKVLSSRRYQAMTPNAIKLLSCSPHICSLGAEMREMLLHDWFQSFFLVSLRGSPLSTVAVMNPRHLILPVTYTEWVFHTAQYEFSTGSLQVMCGETWYCPVICGCKARCLEVKHSSS